MKIVQINSVPNGSTGSIMLNIHKELCKRKIESYVVWGRGRNSKDFNEIYMNDKIGVYKHKLYTILTGKTGFFSIKSTKKLISHLREIKPDIIHLHNIHGYYINIELLFNYIKENNIKIIWTLHDCWPFTGHCAYFDLVNCYKWKTQCRNCPQYRKYPKGIFDASSWCFDKKKELFSGIDNLTIVTPSIWLGKLVKESYLGDYNIKVINNGIDTSIFKKIDSKKLLFRKKYNIADDKIILLGVASPWSSRKGLLDFIELSKIIDCKYQIVLVGLNKQQLKKLPKNIIGLKRTNNVDELVDIYNSSNIFINPTYQDNYPTTNLEALACGLKVITYNTGGSPESAYSNESDFNVVRKTGELEKNVEELYKSILKYTNINSKKIINVKLLDKKIMAEKYISLYLNDNK